MGRELTAASAPCERAAGSHSAATTSSPPVCCFRYRDFVGLVFAAADVGGESSAGRKGEKKSAARVQGLGSVRSEPVELNPPSRAQIFAVVGLNLFRAWAVGS